MRNLVLSSIFFFLSLQICAQNVVVSNTTSPNSCDGTALFLDTNIYEYWYWYSLPDSSFFQQGGIFIDGLCPGEYGIEMFNNGIASTYNFTITSGLIDCSSLQAQISVIQQPTNPNALDGYISANVSGGTLPYSFAWNNGMTTQNIGNLGVGVYEFCVTDANACLFCSTIELLSDTNVVDPCLNFYVTNSSVNASNENTCDGSVSFTIQGGFSPFIFDNQLFYSSTFTISNLCSGSYTSFIMDSNDCEFTSLYYIGYNNDTTTANLNATSITTNVSNEGSCDGSVFINVNGGISPYTFENSDGSTSQFITNLCEGVYSTIVTDSNGEIVILNYFIASPDNVIDNTNFEDSLIVDTLTNNILENCIIDFLTLDTAFISNIEFVSMDSIIVTWSIIDGNGTIEVNENYSLNSGFGVYELMLQIFCPQRATDQYLIVIEQFRINGSLDDITENNLNQMNVFPNPFENLLTILLDEDSNSKITIKDITGKLILEQNFTTKNIQINTTEFAKGNYFVNVHNDKLNTTKIIAK
jgi:hypothetical protein